MRKHITDEETNPLHLPGCQWLFNVFFVISLFQCAQPFLLCRPLLTVRISCSGLSAYSFVCPFVHSSTSEKVQRMHSTINCHVVFKCINSIHLDKCTSSLKETCLGVVWFVLINWESGDFATFSTTQCVPVVYVLYVVVCCCCLTRWYMLLLLFLNCSVNYIFVLIGNSFFPNPLPTISLKDVRCKTLIRRIVARINCVSPSAVDWAIGICWIAPWDFASQDIWKRRTHVVPEYRQQGETHRCCLWPSRENRDWQSAIAHDPVKTTETDSAIAHGPLKTTETDCHFPWPSKDNRLLLPMAQ